MLPVRSRFLLGLIIGLALVPCIAFGQVTTATLTGTVKDAQGNVVPGATVVLTSDTRGGLQVGTTVTDAKGDFIFPGTMPDTYSVTVSLEGFKTRKISGFAVSPGDRVGLPAHSRSRSARLLKPSPSPAKCHSCRRRARKDRSRSRAGRGPEPADIEPEFHKPDRDALPWCQRHQPRMGDQTSYSGAANSNIMMDGVSTMDSGNNAASPYRWIRRLLRR